MARYEVAQQRDAYGGTNWGAAFFGWLVAIGLGALLTALVSAAGAAIAFSEIETVGEAAGERRHDRDRGRDLPGGDRADRLLRRWLRGRADVALRWRPPGSRRMDLEHCRGGCAGGRRRDRRVRVQPARRHRPAPDPRRRGRCDHRRDHRAGGDPGRDAVRRDARRQGRRALPPPRRRGRRPPSARWQPTSPRSIATATASTTGSSGAGSRRESGSGRGTTSQPRHAGASGRPDGIWSCRCPGASPASPRSRS